MSIFTPSTALYQDVLDYLDRRGIPSIAGIFDDYDQATNPYLTNENVKSVVVPENIVPPDPALRGPVQIEGRDDGPRGTGLFGNLEPGSKRTVLVDGVPTEVYTNITSGLTQTFDGKNVKGNVTETGAFDYEFDAISPGVEIYAADAPPSFSLKEEDEEDDEDDNEGIAGLSIGDYDYGTFGPSTSAFSYGAKKGVAVQQGAVDLAARLAEIEKKKKLKELQDKIDAQGGNQGATFSGGKVTGSLGQGQSPHSSMSDRQGDNRSGPGDMGGGVGGQSMGPGGPGGPRRV